MMSKRVAAIVGIVLLSAPGMAVAKEKFDPRVQAMLTCEAIKSSEARLQCYDQAMAALRPALVQGAVIVKEKKAPVARGGVIQASGRTGDENFWVVLENGDRWALRTPGYHRDPPATGMTVKIRRTFMGSYWLSGTKWPESEADYLGPVND
jgi:hypothetical protein